MRSKNGVYVISTMVKVSPMKYGPAVCKSSSLTKSKTSSNPTRFAPSAHPLVSHPIHRLNNCRSSFKSSLAFAFSGEPALYGSNGVCFGNASSSASAIAAESVINTPSISIAGNVPERTLLVKLAGLSP